jgi:esterase/lipase superfamily enzyme
MMEKYHKWHSLALGRDMELKVFGHDGPALLVFPTSMGRFFQYPDMEMISVVADKYESGKLQAFCVDSVDSESWYNKSISPKERVARHNQYEQYLLLEVVPFIRSLNSSGQLCVTGCSFGGYHSLNFALRHPDIVTHCISMGGAFDIKQFLDGYYDQDCYYHNPPDFLPNLNDGWYWDRYQKMKFVLAVGEHDICLSENQRMAGIMDNKSVPHWLDVWGNGTAHDWPWWRQMAVKYF